jgi:hypothetical protein
MEKQSNSNPDEAADTARAGMVASGAREHLTGLLEENGILDDDMDEDEKAEAIEEWEGKLAKRIGKDQDDTAKFRDGNKKVITKHL